MSVEVDAGFGPVTVALAEGEDALSGALGFAAGLALARLADPEAPGRAWLRAAPLIAGAALLLAVRLGSPTWSITTALTDFGPAALVLAPPAAVTLAQLAAAVAGRGRPAPLLRAARWARLALLGAGVPWAYGVLTTYGRSPVATAICALCLAAAALAALARRPPLPGVSLAFAGALVAGWVVQDVQSYAGLPGLRVPSAGMRALLVVQIALETLGPAALAVAVRRLRFDRRALAALGIDAGAPGELVAAFLPCYLAVGWAASSVTDMDGDMLALNATLTAGWLATTAALLLALRYLRRLLDAAEGRRPAAGAALRSP